MVPATMVLHFSIGKPEDIVIAHRGTDSIASLVADYELFSLVLPKQLPVAQNFTDQIRRTYIPNQNKILWHTGHSLGGAIAEFLVANETLSVEGTLNSLSFAVTFDSPGIMELLEVYHREQELKYHREQELKYLKTESKFWIEMAEYGEELLKDEQAKINNATKQSKHVKKKPVRSGATEDRMPDKLEAKFRRYLPESTEFRVISYLSEPNIVNTMGTHVGLALQLFHFPPIVKTWHPVIETLYNVTKRTFFRKYKTFIDFARTHSIEQFYSHRLQSIIEGLELRPFGNGNLFKIQTIIKWPKGQQELVRFLRFKNSTMFDSYSDEDVIYPLLNYHVVSLGNVIYTKLPTELFPKKIQHFLNRQFKRGIPESVLTQLNTNCPVFKLIGETATKLIFDKILKMNVSTLFQQENVEMFGLNLHAVPTFEDERFKFDILKIYTLLSLANSDECIFD